MSNATAPDGWPESREYRGRSATPFHIDARNARRAELGLSGRKGLLVVIDIGQAGMIGIDR
jgi:hypothetical protein